MDQTIFRLSDRSNAHAELWDQISYNSTGININFRDKFGFDATWDRACSKPIFWFSGETNAHIYTGFIDSITMIGVCFGGLSCKYKEDACDANLAEKCIVKLSENNSAHMELCDYSNYSISVCCNVGCGEDQLLCADGICRPDCGGSCLDDGLCSASEGCYCQDCIGNTAQCGGACTNNGVCDASENCTCPDCSNNIANNLGHCGGTLGCDHDQQCDSDESCNCDDCFNEQDSCQPNMVCSQETETCQIGCTNGTRMCVDGQCREDCGGDELLCNLNSTCDIGLESCSCADCLYQQDSCVEGLICYNETPDLNDSSVCRDPDDDRDICEALVPGLQDVCDLSKESGCWDPNTYDNNHCCGASSYEAWIDKSNNVCCMGQFYRNDTKEEDSACVCSMYGQPLTNFRSINLCDVMGDKHCWNIGTEEDKQHCCGDIGGETWDSVSYNYLISEALPKQTCSNGTWYKRDESQKLTPYDIWATS